jgi:hypothetical protein
MSEIGILRQLQFDARASDHTRHNDHSVKGFKGDAIPDGVWHRFLRFSVGYHFLGERVSRSWRRI